MKAVVTLTTLVALMLLMLLGMTYPGVGTIISVVATFFLGCWYSVTMQKLLWTDQVNRTLADT